MIEALVERAWSCFFDKSPPSSAAECPNGTGPAHKGATNGGNGTDDKKGPLGPPVFSVGSSNNCAMADGATVDHDFLAMLVELDLNEERQAELMAQPREWKWRMLTERQRAANNRGGRGQQGPGGEAGPDWALGALEEYGQHFPDAYALPLAVQQLEALAVQIRTQSASWLDCFLSEGGLPLLTRLLDRCHGGLAAEQIALPVLASVRALLNSTMGHQCVQQSAEMLRSVAWALDLQNARCKVIALEILSGLCLCAELGHRAVLRALTDVKALRGERTRFQRLVDDLHREHGSARDTERVRVGLMSLVNALLKGGNAEHCLELRVHLRHEFLMLGIQQVLERIRSNEDSDGGGGSGRRGPGSALDDHLDLFDMMRQEDDQEMLQSSSSSGSASPDAVPFENAPEMAQLLARRLDHSLALPHLQSLLQHLLMVPADKQHLPLWHAFDLVLQQLILQRAAASFDPQLDGLQCPKLDWDELLARLRTESDCDRLARQLAQCERELAEERQRALELENRLSDLQDSASLASLSRVSEHSASSSPSDPCHSPPPSSFGPSSSSLPPIRPPSGQIPPPPPPSALQLRPGAPFPSSPSVPKKRGVPKPSCTLRTLNWTLIPAQNIAGTVWEGMDEEQLYKEIDVASLCDQFAAGKSTGCGGDDPEDQLGNGTLASRAGRTLAQQRQNERISVVDARRAQNCTIMLSRLKMAHREIRHTVLGMDDRGRLSRDILEQMMKFVPLRDELQLIRETLTQRRKSPQALALADRFLWEMGQISRYEPRLRALCTIRSFQDRIDELRPAIGAISRASTALNASKRFRQWLALVLAVGNVLNYGKRNGNAFGFTVNSLDQLAGVRSALRQDRNLMHFLAQSAEHKWPDLVPRLRRELGSALFEAARVDRGQLEAELRQLESALRELGRELAVQRQQQAEKENNSNGNANGTEQQRAPPPDEPSAPHCPQQQRQQPLAQNNNRATAEDRFVPVVTAFLEQARAQLAQLQQEHAEMAQNFLECARFFGCLASLSPPSAKGNAGGKGGAKSMVDCRPSPSAPDPQQLFGPVARCVNTIVDSQRALWAEREEQEARQRHTLVRRAMGRRQRRQPSGAAESVLGTGKWPTASASSSSTMVKDFEALVNMLQTGELFSAELSRLRHSVRATPAQRQQPAVVELSRQQTTTAAG